MIGSTWNSFFSFDQFWFWLLVSGWCLCLTLPSSGARRLYISDPFGGANCARLSGSVGSSHLNLQQRFGLIEGPVCAEPYSGLSLSQKTQFPWGGAACKAAKENSGMKISVDKHPTAGITWFSNLIAWIFPWFLDEQVWGWGITGRKCLMEINEFNYIRNVSSLSL